MAETEELAYTGESVAFIGPNGPLEVHEDSNSEHIRYGVPSPDHPIWIEWRAQQELSIGAGAIRHAQSATDL